MLDILYKHELVTLLFLPRFRISLNFLTLGHFQDFPFPFFWAFLGRFPFPSLWVNLLGSPGFPFLKREMACSIFPLFWEFSLFFPQLYFGEVGKGGAYKGLFFNRFSFGPLLFMGDIFLTQGVLHLLEQKTPLVFGRRTTFVEKECFTRGC